MFEWINLVELNWYY